MAALVRFCVLMHCRVLQGGSFSSKTMDEAKVRLAGKFAYNLKAHVDSPKRV